MDTPEHLPGMASYAPGWERTEVSRPVAVVVSLLFGAGLLAVPLFDAWQGAWRAPAEQIVAAAAGVRSAWGGEGRVSARLLAANRAALAGISRVEAAVEDASVAAAWGRPFTLDLLLRWGGAGSEEAYVGHDAWLFYRPDVDALDGSAERVEVTARGLARWAADLAERGVALVFVPVPGKASIHPEQLAFGRRHFAGPLMPPGWEKFEELLASAWQGESATRGLEGSEGPRVVDAAQVLWTARGDAHSSEAAVKHVYLPTDSHWTPAGMEAVAEAVAAAVADRLSVSLATVPPASARQTIAGIGDTARMLDLPPGSVFLRRQDVEIAPVEGVEGGSWQPDRSAPVLLVGDSYTNIYSTADLGWGESAGLAERLSHRLGFAVDRLARNDAGALDARLMVSAEAARNPGWLEGKKVVVWPLAMRELVGGDWRPVEALPSASAGDFLVLAPGETREVSAQVAAVGPLPPAGQTPYADYLTAVHLTGVDGTDAQVVAYVFTMKDRKLLPAEALVPGRRVRVRLASYEERATELDPLNRGELEDIALLLETPNFAEWILPADR